MFKALKKGWHLLEHLEMFNDVAISVDVRSFLRLVDGLRFGNVSIFSVFASILLLLNLKPKTLFS